MVLPNPSNGPSVPDLLHSFKNGGTFVDDDDDFTTAETHRFSEEIDSSCSTPYVSAPSSPGRSVPSGYFFSAPASPMHYVLSSGSSSQAKSGESNVPGSFEFEFSSRFSSNVSVGPGSMSSADELFFNGQIRPMKLSSHLQRPQMLAPLLDLEVEEDEESRDDAERGNREETVVRGRDLRSRNRSLHRKTRSMSPLRNSQFPWPADDDANAEIEVIEEHILELEDKAEKQGETPSTETTPSVSASSSRSSSSGRNSKKWIFLKDLLYRSKSEGRANGKEKFWSSMSFSPAKEKNATTTPSTPSAAETQKQKKTKQSTAKKSSAGKPANGVSKRRGVPPSPHELHYTANRAQAEEMKKKTFLPYRQGLLGCLGFSSKGYGALNGFTRTLNPVSSSTLIRAAIHINWKHRN